jgi:hypothetical protein
MLKYAFGSITFGIYNMYLINLINENNRKIQLRIDENDRNIQLRIDELFQKIERLENKFK